jgi:predicted O-linked N-acetylglucosamine transferase (SPINDLY family)
MRVLAATKGSVLWLFFSNAAQQSNLRRAAERYGVAGSRLIFAERATLPEHLARHRLADLFLDTTPYNAHTTASDALWAGLPLLTYKGKSFASRVSASLLHALELDELVTESLEEYQEQAKALASNPATLARIRDKLALQRDSSELFDGSAFARHLEASYDEMASNYRAGLPPRPIRVSN